MIIQAILDVLTLLFDSIMSFLPRMEVLQIPQSLFDGLNYLLSCAAYFLPMTDIVVILSSFLIITNFRFVYNLLNRLWDMLPFT